MPQFAVQLLIATASPDPANHSVIVSVLIVGVKTPLVSCPVTTIPVHEKDVPLFVQPALQTRVSPDLCTDFWSDWELLKE
jgi:hypothetical protein